MRVPGSTPIDWDGPEESLAQVLRHLVFTKEVWLAAIEGDDFPDRRRPTTSSTWSPGTRPPPRGGWRWCATSSDAAPGATASSTRCATRRRASCSAASLAHVLTFSAHRRQLARLMLRDAGVDVDHGDPIDWLRRRTGGTP